MNAGEITQKLIEAHPREKGWSAFRELQSGTGRAIDLYLMNTWASNGRALAIEIKVSRGDFNRELDNPSKRQPWETLASECWFACPSGIIKPDEVPDGWGLMIVGKRVMRKKRPPQRRIDAWPADFVRALARRTEDPVPALPLGSWVLQNGRVVRSADIRRLADRLLRRDTSRERARTWALSQDPRLEKKRKRIQFLGRVIAALERHFQRRFNNISEVTTALRASGTRYPAEAAYLRQLADRLEGNP